MHISSTLSFEQIRSLPTIIEWLDTYNYFIKLFPSHKEEMIQIGVLCYSNVFMYHEDLKAEILAHPQWLPQDPDNVPILDLQR